MKVQGTFTYEDITIVFRTSMLEQSLYMLWARRFEQVAEQNPELNYFDIWLSVAASIVEVSGDLDWQRPSRQVDEDGIIQSYIGFMSQVTLQFFNALYAAISDLNSPLADELDRTDDMLTEEQKKTVT